MSPHAAITASLQESARTLEALTQESACIAAAAQAMLRAYRGGKKVVAFGNGGSSCDALHLAAELVGRCERDRRGLPAFALVGNPAVMTALGNDYGYERTFARQVEACVERGDIVVAISTSGNSPNVLEGVRQAKRQGAMTIGLTGASGGRLKTLVDVSLCVPTHRTPRIQEGHLAIIHTMCEVIEAALCTDGRSGERTRGGEAGYTRRHSPTYRKVLPLCQLAPLVEQFRLAGQRIVVTNGCFDVLHGGHLELLRRARQYGDWLIVALNSNRSVRALKGRGRPLVPARERAELLAGLEMVDFVTIFTDPTPTRVMRCLRPDVLVKGADYRPGAIVGRQWAKRTVRVPLVRGRSTSNLIRRILSRCQEDSGRRERGREGVATRGLGG